MKYIIKKVGFRCGKETDLCKGCCAESFGSRILTYLGNGKARTNAFVAVAIGTISGEFGGLNGTVHHTFDGGDVEKVVFHSLVRIGEFPCRENSAEVLVWANAAD